MWKTIKPILASLFGSKKFLAFLAGVLVWLASKAGLSLTEADVTPVLVLLGSYIVGQGIADAGKEAKKIEAATVKELHAEAAKSTAGKP